MRIRSAIIAALATAGLGGCTSDPAFWDAVAQGLDQAAYEIANEPVCTWYTDRFGILQQSCVPAYAVNAPTYYPVTNYRDEDRDRGRRDRDRDGRRDGRRENDRDDRRDHHGRRGPKGE
ncbi:hypothetical protein [Brevundimonas sp.]|uniref:hypothetical protein n=1 Tax=Brevundimonas sp. TaxID=1871086 RepID=UPI002FC6C300